MLWNRASASEGELCTSALQYDNTSNVSQCTTIPGQSIINIAQGN